MTPEKQASGMIDSTCDMNGRADGKGNVVLSVDFQNETFTVSSGTTELGLPDNHITSSSGDTVFRSTGEHRTRVGALLAIQILAA